MFSWTARWQLVLIVYVHANIYQTTNYKNDLLILYYPMICLKIHL